ncbi:hypothetical protein [Sneathiella sp.]|uniref:hypothetical protein n=1 Tax=Sneathiella sp. TaxID=1964365 RepID=UPI002FE16973
MSMAIATAGYSCDPAGVLYRGIDPESGSGFYGVLCQSGTHYMVSLPNDPSVHSQVAECAALKPLDIHCF